MNGKQRDRLILGTAFVLAVLVALDIANGEVFWVALATVVCGGLMVLRYGGDRTLEWLLLVLWAGYIVSNRGFAQLSPTAGLPLFPSELGLGIGCLFLIGEAIGRRRLPFRHDLENTVLWLWVAYGSLRLVLGPRGHGMDVLRDYALVYYTLFCFLAQRSFEIHDWLPRLDGLVRWSTLVLLPLHVLFEAYQEFFVTQLVVRGNPLIYLKGDLVGSYLAIGSLAWYFHFQRGAGRWTSAWVALALFGGVVLTHNRASLLGLGVAGLMLVVAGHWRLLRHAGAALALGGLVLGLGMASGKVRWQDTPLPAIQDALVSVFDVQGTVKYSEEGIDYKGDNNRFRIVWWRNVINETLTSSPLVGLGFGHDLAAQFLREYYPDNDEEFTARSPHSVVVTVIGRLGIIGLSLFLLLAVVIARDCFSSLARFRTGLAALPAVATMVLGVAACLGVVLEGPMGAVLFWSAYGLVRASLRQAKATQTPQIAQANLDKAPSTV